MIVARETVFAKPARRKRRSLDHATHLVVHGVLHLLGHTHDGDEDATRMEALEVAALRGSAGRPVRRKRHSELTCTHCLERTMSDTSHASRQWKRDARPSRGRQFREAVQFHQPVRAAARLRQRGQSAHAAGARAEGRNARGAGFRAAGAHLAAQHAALRWLRVEDVMVPRADIVAIDEQRRCPT